MKKKTAGGVSGSGFFGTMAGGLDTLAARVLMLSSVSCLLSSVS